MDIVFDQGEMAYFYDKKKIQKNNHQKAFKEILNKWINIILKIFIKKIFNSHQS